VRHAARAGSIISGGLRWAVGARQAQHDDLPLLIPLSLNKNWPQAPVLTPTHAMTNQAGPRATVKPFRQNHHSSPGLKRAQRYCLDNGLVGLVAWAPVTVRAAGGDPDGWGWRSSVDVRRVPHVRYRRSCRGAWVGFRTTAVLRQVDGRRRMTRAVAETGRGRAFGRHFVRNQS
jgi:hypothetical protein